MKSYIVFDVEATTVISTEGRNLNIGMTDDTSSLRDFSVAPIAIGTSSKLTVLPVKWQTSMLQHTEN